MKNTSEMNALMYELLESQINLETMEITERGREIIDEISDYAEQTRIFQEHKGAAKCSTALRHSKYLGICSTAS